MRYTQPTYTKLTQEGEKVYLIDEGEINRRRLLLADVPQAFQDIRTMLEDAELPTERKWIEAVSKRGADGLEDMVRTQTEEDIKRLNLPKFSANQWRKSCVQDVPSEAWSLADRLHTDIVAKCEELPGLEGSFGYDEKKGIIIDTDTVEAGIKRTCRVEVTPEMQSQANQLQDLSKTVRKLEMAGVNALELIKKYTHTTDTPDPLTMYADIATRRHAPGTVFDQDIARIINEAALRRFQPTK